MKNFTVIFYPDGKKISVPEGTSLLKAAAACGIFFHSSCGGEGICGRCRVIVKKGSVERYGITSKLSAEEQEKGYALACRSLVRSDVEIDIPAGSRQAPGQVMTEEYGTARLNGLFRASEGTGDTEPRSPLSEKIHLKLPPPSIKDSAGDAERLCRELKTVTGDTTPFIGLERIRLSGSILRKSGWDVTATIARRGENTEIIMLEPGDASGRNFGIAVDIGTTSVVAELVDLAAGKVLAAKVTRNSQARHGDDVITRMVFAEKNEGLEKLHHLITDTLNDLVSALAEENRIGAGEITSMACAGNATMLHLLLKIDPSCLRKEPYVPAANIMPAVRASEIGIRINPLAPLACLPGVSSYVGADIVAGTLASGIYREEKTCLLIDIGTNGEIVLGNREWLACCASSAGPAFEGSGVRCGVWAMDSAIHKMEINSVDLSIKYSTIGGVEPVGICGSGYIECISEMFRTGIIDRAGRIAEKSFPGMRKGPDGAEIVIAKAGDNPTGRDIVITQADITNLILSKGAVYTAASVLLKKTNLRFMEIDKIYLAGGFGNYLNIDKAICIGLLPDIPREKFRYIGNSSLSGARMALLSSRAMAEAGNVAKKMTYIDLSTDPSFMNDYTGSLFLPHTDTSLFPTSCLR